MTDTLLRESVPEGRVRGCKRFGVYLTFCVFVGMSASFLYAGEPPTSYGIGAVPAQVAWHGEVLSFSLSAGPSSGIAFSMVTSPPPVGPISLSSATGMFSYSPDPNDLRPFDVTVSADVEGKHISHTFRITPSFKPEYSLIGRGVPKGPEDDITVSEVRHVEDEFFNGSTDKRKRKSIFVSGKTVIIDTVAPHNKIYNLFSYSASNKVDNIREAVIYAETLVINAPLKLPQTNVTIYARELRFESNGSIDTSPLSDWKNADAPANDQPHCKSSDFVTGDRPTDGKAGNDAGQIFLHINHFSADGALKRFIMRGGTGQSGGPGHNGRDGNSMTILSPQYSAVFIDNHGELQGKQEWPQDGCDAVPDGKNGNAGNGGDLWSNSPEVFRYADPGGGWTPPGFRFVKYSGGQPGKPNPAKWIRIEIVRSCSGSGRENRTCTTSYVVHVLQEHSPSEGQAVLGGLPPDKPTGNAGQFHILSGQDAGWMHPAIVYQVLKYAKDLYIRGYLDDARSIVLDYSLLLSGMKERPKDFDAQFTEQELQLANLSQRLASNLDYFGFPAGYAPLLSLETNLQLYQNEIATAIPVLYLSYWLKDKEHSLEDKKQALSEGVDKLSRDTASAIGSYNSMQVSVGNIKVEATNVAQQIATTEDQLKLEEARLEEKARSDVEAAHRLPAWKQALGTLAVIAKVFPVYQPVLGSIGSGLDAVSQIDTAKPLETAEKISNVADQLTTETLNKSYDDLHSHIQQLNPHDAKGARDFVKKALPMAKQIAEAQQTVAAATQVAQAPQSEIEAQLNKLKSEDPEFISLTNQVEALEADKAKLARDIATTLQQLATASDRIVNNVATIDAFNDELNSTVASLNPKTALYLDEIERRANETLLKYHYYVAKAYEYRLLRPYAYSLNLETQFKDLLQLATADTQFDSLLVDKSSSIPSQTAPVGGTAKAHSAVLSADEYARLALVYKESLEGTLKDLVDLYNSNVPERNDKFYYSLQPTELEALNSKPGRTVTINLQRLGRVRADEENQRIVSIQSEVSAHKTGANVGSTSMKIAYTLPLSSEIRAGSGNFIFRHPDALEWGTSCNFRQESSPCEKNEVKVSSGSTSLMDSLLPRTWKFDSVALSEPSLLGDITITNTLTPDDPTADVSVDKLELQIIYDYHKRQADRVSLMVQVPVGLTPYISISAIDRNGLKDGMGDFVRDYPRKSKVTVAAPPVYGGRKFLEWREGGVWVGSTLVGGKTIPSKGSEVEVDLPKSRSVRAVYDVAPGPSVP